MPRTPRKIRSTKRPRKRSAAGAPGARHSRLTVSKLAALQLEVESAVALLRRHTEELAIQFKRIAQLQAELDDVKKSLRVGG